MPKGPLFSTRPNATQELLPAHGTDPCRPPTRLPADGHTASALCQGSRAAPKIALARLWQKKERRCQRSLSVPGVPGGTKLPARARCWLPTCWVAASRHWQLGSARAGGRCSAGPCRHHGSWKASAMQRNTPTGF